MLSTSEVIWTESTTLVLSTRTLKAIAPPGSRMDDGLAVLVTAIDEGASLRVTVAVSESWTGAPSSSVPEAVIVSVSESPALPVTLAVNEQV